MNEDNIIRLIKEYQKGNESAFEELVNLFSSFINKISSKYTNKRIDPKDVKQQAMILLSEASLRYNFNKKIKAKKFLENYIKNRTIDYYEKEMKNIIKTELIPDGDIVDDTTEFYNNDFNKKISELDFNSLVSKLDNNIDKQIMFYYFVEDMTHDEIAYELNISQPAVTKRFNKILQKIKKFL